MHLDITGIIGTGEESLPYVRFDLSEVGMPVASSKEECRKTNETVELYEVVADHRLLYSILSHLHFSLSLDCLLISLSNQNTTLVQQLTWSRLP
jgi:hypothetical protein